MGLDINAWLPMLIISFISIGLLAYRYTDKARPKPCVPVKIVINGKARNGIDTFNVGDELLFSTFSSSKKEITWSLNSTAHGKQGNYFSHRFFSEGKFFIVATIDDNCSSKAFFYVKKHETIKENSVSDALGKLIKGTDFTTAGVKTKYIFDSACESYEWNILNSTSKTQTTREATFQFPGAGIYTIQVTIDHDRNKRAYKDVVVEPAKSTVNTIPNPERRIFPGDVPAVDTPAAKPAVVEPPKKVVIQTSDQSLKDYLIDVVNGRKKAEDLYKYLVYQGGTQVQKSKSVVSFNEFCQDIGGKGEDKIRIESVEQRSDNAGIVLLKVKYFKRVGSLVGLIKHWKEQ